MKLAALLVLVGLTGTMCASCPENCTLATTVTEMSIRHVSPLMDSSVAPWDLVEDRDVNRRPHSILMAKCRRCIIGNMSAEPIHLQILVHKTVLEGEVEKMCLCPFKLSVGCTCVNKP